MKTLVGDTVFEQDKKGNWIQKSKIKIPTLKTSSVYKDAPRYPVIFEYEGEFKTDYQQMLANMKDEIVNEFKKIL